MFLLPLSLPPLLHFPFLVTSYYPAVVNFIPRDRTKERRWYQTVFARLLLHSGAFWHQRISGHATPPSPSLDRPLFARGKSYFLTLPPWNTRYEKFVRATRPFLLWKKERKSGFRFENFFFRLLLSWYGERLNQRSYAFDEIYEKWLYRVKC